MLVNALQQRFMSFRTSGAKLNAESKKQSYKKVGVNWNVFREPAVGCFDWQFAGNHSPVECNFNNIHQNRGRGMVWKVCWLHTYLHRTKNEKKQRKKKKKRFVIHFSRSRGYFEWKLIAGSQRQRWKMWLAGEILHPAGSATADRPTTSRRRTLRRTGNRFIKWFFVLLEPNGYWLLSTVNVLRLKRSYGKVVNLMSWIKAVNREWID